MNEQAENVNEQAENVNKQAESANDEPRNVNEMTEKELNEIAELCKNATAGPWQFNFSIDDDSYSERFFDLDPDHPPGTDQALESSETNVLIGFDAKWTVGKVGIRKKDADFIAASREVIPRLLAEVQRYRETIKLL